VKRMKATGFAPAVVVETSPGNFQAWPKHSRQLPRDLSTLAARSLAEEFGGDRGAADWRHFGRLSGLTNRKGRHMGENGLFPFVRLIEASGKTYPEGDTFVATIVKQRELEQRAREERRVARFAGGVSRVPRSIDDFRTNPRYGGDATRVDLAYAIYALSHGANEAEVAAAIRSRDLSHKGDEKRQNQYVDRTVGKALKVTESRCL
jgi:hypothetical protein